MVEYFEELEAPPGLFKPFEEDILRKWKEGGTFGVAPKAAWIKGHLAEVRSDFINRLFRRYEDFCRRAASIDITISPGSYQSFRTYMYILRKLDLIRFVREGAVPQYFNRKYYRLNPRMVDSELWNRPLQEAYPSTDWTLKPAEVKEKIRKESLMRAKARKPP